MDFNEDTWKVVQGHLGYNEEEMKLFRSDPRNEDALTKTAAMLNKTMVVEVIESHGCDSGHKVGDKFFFDGRGISLLTKLGPNRICIFALHSIALAMTAMAELFYAGVDPNTMRFKRFGCPDVGIRCGGWGHVVMEVSIKDRDVPVLAVP
ncbi:MAG: TIGR04076 family protein [Deltaproteobacteria bacterium]|nr:TIGR04076 family protein [Deltaproteobacteria bacterium]